ncbi:MAG: IS110 family transposase [Planctomycetes bacterium]|nr:IS110 family transposase [Planctomycetota bacterium]MBL7039112.1 IS110 family transposase [Pirellulaceae bacterium]
MLYLGIDLHLKQITVSLRNEGGDVVLRRQVSTRWPKLAEFRTQLAEAAADDEKYVAVVEVCGFHDWFVKWLRGDPRCHMVLLVQPLGRSAVKTDRRDAHALSELLWINRERLLRGERVHGVRTVHQPDEDQQADRRLTQLRERLVWRRTQTINQVHKILRRNNLEWDRPTKTFQTCKVIRWLRSMQLNSMDRLAMNQLLVQWKLWEEQLLEVDTRMTSRFLANRDAQLLATIPGVNTYIALAIACRIAPIERFPHGRSLANFLGLTPGCRSSGETERPGSITKVGSRMVRSLIAQVILHLLRKDGAVRTWYQRIKRRRGSRIARVAVMRRTAAIMQRMLSKGEPWRAEKVDSATSETENKRRRVQPRQRRKTVPSALAERRTESPSSSTGSSSLLTGEEVAQCPV